MHIMVHQQQNQSMAFLNITQEVQTHLQQQQVKVGKAIKNNIHHPTAHPQFQQKKGSPEMLMADINILVLEVPARFHNQVFRHTTVLIHNHYMYGIETTVPFQMKKSVNVVEVRLVPPMTAINQLFFYRGRNYSLILSKVYQSF